MRELATLTRRAAAALPLVALIRPAAAATPVFAPAGDDAVLLDLGRRWEAAIVSQRAHSAKWSASMTEPAAGSHEEIAEALHEATSDLFRQIVLAPATTPAGLAVKAKALAYENDLEDLDEMAIATALSVAHYYEDRIAFSLALDCLRLARTAS